MRRLAMIIGLAGAMLMPGTAFAFHHLGLPSTACAADAAGSPSNDNGQAKENLLAHAPVSLPLPPVGTLGNGKGEGGEFCANGD